MAKKRIRLSEGKLRRIIGESVSRLVREAAGDYKNDMYVADHYCGGNLDTKPHLLPDRLRRDSFPEGKAGDEEYSWALRDDATDPSDYSDPQCRTNAYPEYGRDMWGNRERLHTLNRQTDYHSDWRDGDHCYVADGEPYPTSWWAGGSDGRRRKWNDWVEDGEQYIEMNGKDVRGEFDERQRELRDLEKADRRPLHRKGSLNRELMRNESANRRLDGIIRESVRQSVKRISEGKRGYESRNNDNYSHFAVWKPTGKIVNGWDYSEYDPDELRLFRKDYFIVDLEDYGIDPKQCRILSDRSLRRMGIDPDDDSNWGEPV